MKRFRDIPAVPADRAEDWVRHDDPARWTSDQLGAQLMVLAMRRAELGRELEARVLLAAARVLVRRQEAGDELSDDEPADGRRAVA